MCKRCWKGRIIILWNMIPKREANTPLYINLCMSKDLGCQNFPIQSRKWCHTYKQIFTYHFEIACPISNNLSVSSLKEPSEPVSKHYVKRRTKVSQSFYGVITNHQPAHFYPFNDRFTFCMRLSSFWTGDCVKMIRNKLSVA